MNFLILDRSNYFYRHSHSHIPRYVLYILGYEYKIYIFNYYVGRAHAKGINGPIHAVYVVMGRGGRWRRRWKKRNGKCRPHCVFAPFDYRELIFSQRVNGSPRALVVMHSIILKSSIAFRRQRSL